MKRLFLFDMDGVLLEHSGYHTALRHSLQHIGHILGAPRVEITEAQISKFESLSVTNEWDTLAIVAALLLVDLWPLDPNLRLENTSAKNPILTRSKLEIDGFLNAFTPGDLPGHAAYDKIILENPDLTQEQQDHLKYLLHNCRNLHDSLTVNIHQERVLGSQRYQEYYGMEPQLNTESYLLKYDHPLMSSTQFDDLTRWLAQPGHHAGILTNRPCITPAGYLSAPEAELGAACVGLTQLPIMGSGLLTWYALTQRGLPEFTYLKPNPVHTLALLQMILGEPAETALAKAAALTDGKGNRSDWEALEDTRITVFEDSAKGLQSGLAAQGLLGSVGVPVTLFRVGIAADIVKQEAIADWADLVVTDINHLNWDQV